MKKIQLETTVNIDLQTWVDQINRFSTIEDNAFVSFPKSNKPSTLEENKITFGKALIEVQYNKPLSTGFHGKVIYHQQYDAEVEQAVIGKDGLPTDETTREIKTLKHKVIEYDQFISADVIKQKIDQAMNYVPKEITSFLDRLDFAVAIIVKTNVLEFKTFWLKDNQWKTL